MKNFSKIFLTILFATIFWAQSADAAVTFDATVNSGSMVNMASKTWSHTTSGTERYLIVGIAGWDGASALSGATVTYGGVAMTKIGGFQVSSNYQAVLWGLVNPATGANNVVVSGIAGFDELGGGSVSFTGVHQTTSLGTLVTENAPTADASVNLTLSAGDMGVDLFYYGAGGSLQPGVGAGGTMRVNTNFLTTQWVMMATEAGSGSVAMNWTGTVGEVTQIAIPIKASAGAGDTTQPTVSLTPPPANGATISGASVALSATANDNIAVAGVQFKRDTGTNIGAEDTTSPYSGTLDSTTIPNGSHTLHAVARDAAGNRATSTITVTVSNSVPDTTPPTAPSNLIATAVSSTQINLTWNVASDNIGVTNYHIERCTLSGCSNYAQIAVVGAAPTTYSDIGLSPNTYYKYRVYALDGAGNGDSPPLFSNTDDATTNVAAPTVGNIRVKATKDGAQWEGPLAYQIIGPVTINGNAIATGGTLHQNLPGNADVYTLHYVSGGPAGASYSSISLGAGPPSCSLPATSCDGTLNDGATVQFTINFGTSPVDIKADGQDSSTIAPNASATISWTGPGMTSCYVTPGNKSGISGSFSTGPLSTDQTYNLSCGAWSPPAGAAGMWRLDENTGLSASDSSGNNNNGSFSGSPSPSWVSGNAGSAVQFGPGLNSVRIPTSPTIAIDPDLVTISAWIYHTSGPSAVLCHSIVDSDPYLTYGFRLVLCDDNALGFWRGAANWGAGGPTRKLVQMDTWQHVAVVATPVSVKFYINGEEAGADFHVEGSSDPSSHPLTIGGTSFSDSEQIKKQFYGRIDDVAVFAGALSQAQIQQMHAESSAEYTDSVVVSVVPPIPPDYSLSATPPGTTATSNGFRDVTSSPTTIKVVAIDGFDDDVTLTSDITTIPGLTGASDSFSDTVLNLSEYNTGSILKFNIPKGTQAGVYTITITGTSASLSDRFVFPALTLNLVVAEPRFREI